MIPVKCSVLSRLRNMQHLNIPVAIEISNRPRNFEDSKISPRCKSERIDSAPEYLFAIVNNPEIFT